MSSNNFHATAICSSCHQPGHATRNNRRCPNYRRTHRNVPEETHTTQANMHQRRPCECGSTDHQRRSSLLCPLHGREMHNLARQTDFLHPTHTLGSMSYICIHCSSKMWLDEKSSGAQTNPKFRLCCEDGNCMVPFLRDTPTVLRNLFECDDPITREFKKYIRSYNNALSFASLGVNLDTTVQNSIGGTYCFRIHGKVYHRIGSLLTEPGNTPKFAQIYIYDRNEDNQLDTRHQYNQRVNRDTLAALQDLMLTLPNLYVHMFMTMKDFIDAHPDMIENIKFVMKADAAPDPRVYNVPTNNSEIAVIMPGGQRTADETTCSYRDIILRPLNGGRLQRINEKNRAYDALSYPLLFPYGEEGWHMSMYKVDNCTLTPMDYYRFRLMYRNNSNCLHLSGNLFQQYIVDMYAKIEQDRLGYVRREQSKLRVQLYKGLRDALEHNERDLRTIGRRVILPSSFIGSPRHMSQLYQDSISIVRRLGRPDLFITFTCNPNWKEIQDNLLFNQRYGDRPDLCTRVFRLKLKSLMKDLIENNVLGNYLNI